MAAGSGYDARVSPRTSDCDDGIFELPRTHTQVASQWWQSFRKQLSVGLELECFLPDLGALVPTRLNPVETKAGLFNLVAGTLTRRLQQVHGAAGTAPKCRAAAEASQVSTDDKDWGRLWTLIDDGSIKPEMSYGSANPFPVELVSKRMRFDDVDVTLFCDMVHTLSSPPIEAKANESTGLHVHIGKHPDFFSVSDVVRILKAYVRYEPLINRLLPMSRQRNPFCLDLREMLAKVGPGLGPASSEQDLQDHIERAAEKVRGLTPEQRSALVAGVRGVTTKEILLPVLLGEGLIWTSRCDLSLRSSSSQQSQLRVEQWVPPGMVLRELYHGDDLIWKEPGSNDLLAVWDAGNDAEPPNPWDAMEPLMDDAELSCVFTLPQEVLPDKMDFWLFRNGLGLVGKRTDRYCKLNLMRIHLPSEKATIEFRQFPGGNFNRALTIWGWVRFLGQFVAQCLAPALRGGLQRTGVDGPADEAELKLFMSLANETLLLAWYRDTLIQQPTREHILEKMRVQWNKLWDEWRLAASKEGDGESLLEACGAWRRLYWAAGGMKMHFPPEDEVWVKLHTGQTLVDKFMQRLYCALEQKLTDYTSLLKASEEVSRCTSLPTVIKITVDLGGVRRAREEIRLVQVAIQETGGWGQCAKSRLQNIGERGALATELLLDHMRNLLHLCEDSARQQQASTALACDVEEAPSSSDVARVTGQARGGGGTLADLRQDTRRLYLELCGLLAPRADEAQALWRGLQDRGWQPERVEELNRLLAEDVLALEGACNPCLTHA